jgi:very-short-patch-repair endonuclease
VVTSPARTILDLAATLEDVSVRRLMSRAQSKNLANHRLLAQQIDRAHGRAGRGRFARVLAGSPPPTRSELEDRLYDLVLAAGFQRPDVNKALRIAGRRVIPDVRWPEQRLCVEADSRQWHDNPQAALDDAERQALLEAYGERVVRITWAQATAHTIQTIARLAQAGAPRPHATR